jgi:xanthine dehydrogenase YagR molybdenum-binding subunit
MPVAPISGGSQSTASVASAIHAAAQTLFANILQLVAKDEKSPLRGATVDALDVRDGRVFLRSDPRRGETYAEILERHELPNIEVRAEAAPGDEEEHFSMHAFGAQFARVEVDPDLGEVRVRRFVGAFASGRILNAKTARSQYIGGMVFGMGMALTEHTRYDDRTARIMTANLGDYLLPVHADVPAIEAYIVPEEDANVNPVGVKGIGEIGITGAAAAIANAVYHATGIRVRELPITPDKLIGT